MYGCSSVPLVGALVTIRQGVTPIASFTSSGAAHTILVPAAGVYTIEASKVRFVAGSMSVTAVTGVTVNASLTLAPAAGYHCCASCADPYPDTLYLQDSQGVHVMTWTTAGYNPGGSPVSCWEVSYSITRAGFILSYGCVSAPDLSIPVWYQLGCAFRDFTGVVGWSLYQRGYSCGTTNPANLKPIATLVPGSTFWVLYGGGLVQPPGGCPLPLDLSYNITGSLLLNDTIRITETMPGGTGTLQVTGTGCNGLPLPGATVTATLGATSTSGTTDASGIATLLLNAGTWSVVTALGPRFATSSPSSQTITAGGTTSLAVSLAPAAGYACIGGCALPLKTTITLANSGFGSGSISLVENGAGRWVGCHTISRLGKAVSCTTDALVDTPVVYEFVGSDGSLVYRDRTCLSSSTVFLLAGLCSNTNGGPWTTSRTSFACPGSFAATYTTPAGTVTFGAPVTLTLSEP